MSSGAFSAKCVYIEERGGLGIRLVPALVRRAADGTHLREPKIEGGCANVAPAAIELDSDGEGGARADNRANRQAPS
jgi:hypothetical protein